jgi:hypothetical protein
MNMPRETKQQMIEQLQAQIRTDEQWIARRDATIAELHRQMQETALVLRSGAEGLQARGAGASAALLRQEADRIAPMSAEEARS